MDAALRMLNQYGFNLVERHDVHLAPGDILGRDDVLVRLGALPALFTSTITAPGPNPPQPAAGFSGQRTDDMHFSVGGRLLVRFLNGFGSSVRFADLAPVIGAARFVRFQFRDVMQSGIDPVAIALYLREANPVAGPPATRYLLNPEADAFVVTEVIESTQIEALPLDIGSQPVSWDMPAWSRLIGPEVHVTQAEWVQFRGRAAATVAFKCHPLDRTPPGWVVPAWEPPKMIAPGTRVLIRQGAPAPA